MADFVNTIDLLGEEATAAAIIGKTITEFNDDVITEVGVYAFYRCSKLETVNLPIVAKLGDYAMSKSGLKSINLPTTTIVGQSAFYECYSLTSADFAQITNIPSALFYNCSSLKTLILRSNTLCSLYGSNCFISVPAANLTVYVPQKLIESYQTATNWSAMYSKGTQFIAIEGSEYE